MVTTAAADNRKMHPNSTNAKRQLENFASRAAGNGARIRILRELIVSKFGPQHIDFTGNSGGGTKVGAPTCTRARSSRIQCTTATLSLALFGDIAKHRKHRNANKIPSFGGARCFVPPLLLVLCFFSDFSRFSRFSMDFRGFQPPQVMVALVRARGPDSESARILPQQLGLGSDFGLQKLYFVSRIGRCRLEFVPRGVLPTSIRNASIRNETLNGGRKQVIFRVRAGAPFALHLASGRLPGRLCDAFTMSVNNPDF
jgi:hypothetical protein